MSNIYTKLTNNEDVVQTEPLFGKDQVQNNASGYVFKTSDADRLLRFLILGSEGGTYYVSEKKLTLDNANFVVELIKKDPEFVVNTIVDISLSGRAPKNDPAIFALALCACSDNQVAKKLAYDAIPKVCRIGTHIFHFCEMVNGMRKWSAGLRRGVGNFYLNKSADALANQLLKYRQRDGWTHKDVLRLCHAGSTDPQVNDLFKFAVGKIPNNFHPMVEAFLDIQTKPSDVDNACSLIQTHNLTWEMLPTDLLKSTEVWEALLPKMPMTAMLRNLGRLSTLGMLNSNLEDNVKLVVSKIQDSEALKKQRVHPFQILLSLKAYSHGSSLRGDGSWTPTSAIKDALNDAFYSSFDNVVPTGKNMFLGLDISGSMSSPISNSIISCAEATGALAMLYLRTEPYCEVKGFSDTFIDLGLSKNDSLESVMKKIQGKAFGSTDCSIPMTYCLKNKIPVDCFQVLTDCETYAGKTHPSRALREYRSKMGRDSKLVVMGMVSTGFTIANPSDSGMLDVVGFDTSVPEIVSTFITGFSKRKEVVATKDE